LNTYKIKISYNGTSFFGWQVQPQQRTIQGELNKALVKICKSNDIKSVGSGRTDAGVHAREQVARIDLPIQLPCGALLAGINSLIDKDIRVLSVEVCDDQFHPIFSAYAKEYVYLLNTDTIQSAFSKNFVTHFPYHLNYEDMLIACKLFEGEYDFLPFSTKGTAVKTTIRRIFDCSIAVKKDRFLGQYYQISVVGNGFLKQMVRLLVGAIVAVGRGKINIFDIEELLTCGEDRKISAVAPANGLYLNKVFY